MPSPTVLRSSVAGLVALAGTDLDALWRQLSTADQAREALMDVLPALVDTYGSAAATVASDWYDDTRDEVGARGRFTAIPAELREPGTDELARWGINPLFGENPDWDSARSLVYGGLTKRIANAGRETINGSAVADPGADGWQRLAGPGSCDWCRALQERGNVYSETTVNFGAHDNCLCQSTPAWKNQPRPVSPYQRSTRPEDQLQRGHERFREWIAANM